MSSISPSHIKTLREMTNAGIMDCKRALQDAGGDLEKAARLLRERGIVGAARKAGRQAREGVVASYIHLGGKVGVLVEVNCETDFVARNDVFKELVKNITLQIAAASPLCVGRGEVPTALLETERSVYRAQVSGKPPAIVDKIVEGKLEKFYSTACLLEQAFIKDPDLTVGDLVSSKIAELGENIVVRRFIRYQVGEQAESRDESAR